MKKLLISTCLIASAFVVSAFTVVTRTAEGINSYASTDIDRIELTSSGGAVVYLSDAQTVAIPAEQFVSIGFDLSNGVFDADICAAAIAIEGNLLRSGDGGAVALFDAAGREVKSAKSGIVNISDLPSGVYVVKTNTHTSKIVLQ